MYNQKVKHLLLFMVTVVSHHHVIHFTAGKTRTQSPLLYKQNSMLLFILTNKFFFYGPPLTSFIFEFSIYHFCRLPNELKDWQRLRLSLFRLCEADGDRRQHHQTLIRKNKCSDRTCSQRKRGDASSFLSALKISSAALHTLFSIELAVQKRFNQFM